MFSFFVLDFWFFCLLADLFIVLMYVKKEQYVVPFFLVVLGCFLIFPMPQIKSSIDYVIQNPLTVLSGFLIYFAIGSFYTISPYFGKWWRFVALVKQENKKDKEKWIKEIKSTNFKKLIEETDLQMTNSYLRERLKEAEVIVASQILNTDFEAKDLSKFPQVLAIWQKLESNISFENEDTGEHLSIIKPTPELYKSKIIGWIVYWPFHLILFLARDPFKAIGKFIYNLFRNSLTKISDSVWEKD